MKGEEIISTGDLDSDLEQLVEAGHVLAEDVVVASSLSEIDDTQFGRRAYVRAAFALIEGNLNLIADIILRALSRAQIQLSPDELQVLRQQRVATDKAGMAVVTVRFVPIRQRIAPLSGVFARLYGREFTLDRGDQGWTAFDQAVVLRNRITHPKNAHSLHIESAELDGVKAAREWFASKVESLLEKCFGDDPDGFKS